jgi:hypothetical protein
MNFASRFLDLFKDSFYLWRKRFMEGKMSKDIAVFPDINLQVDTFVFDTNDNRSVVLARRTEQAKPNSPTDWFFQTLRLNFDSIGKQSLAVENGNIVIMVADLFGIIPVKRFIMTVAADQRQALESLKNKLNSDSTFFAYPIEEFGEPGFIIVGIKHTVEERLCLWEMAKFITGLE